MSCVISYVHFDSIVEKKVILFYEYIALKYSDDNFVFAICREGFIALVLTDCALTAGDYYYC